MPIDFFIAKCQTENIRDKEFGICDDEDGTPDFRCDAMLTNEDHIVFVELKDQMAGWITHAVDEQLQTIIDNFKANHDISKYKYKRAFACNKKYPNFRVSYKDKMNAFYNKNRIRLNLVREIIFK